MTEMLIKALTLSEHAYNGEKTAIINSIPRNLGIMHEGKLEPVRELLLTEDVNATNLISTEIHNTIIEGAHPAVCMRNAALVLGPEAKNYDIPYGSAGAYAQEVGEGAEIPVVVDEYGKQTIAIKKYGSAPEITDELIDDCKFGIVEAELKRAGRNVENKLNQLVLSELLENSGLEHDANGSNWGTRAIAKAKAKVKGAGYFPDTVLMHSEAEGLVGEDLLPTVGNYPVNDYATSGNLPPIMGLTPMVCDVSDTSSTYTWGYAANGEIGMLVTEKDRSVALGIRRDIQVEDYRDAIRQLKGATVTIRMGTVYIAANAASRVEY